jgi:hypothetical protein
VQASKACAVSGLACGGWHLAAILTEDQSAERTDCVLPELPVLQLPAEPQLPFSPSTAPPAVEISLPAIPSPLFASPTRVADVDQTSSVVCAGLSVASSLVQAMQPEGLSPMSSKLVHPRNAPDAAGTPSAAASLASAPLSAVAHLEAAQDATDVIAAGIPHEGPAAVLRSRRRRRASRASSAEAVASAEPPSPASVGVSTASPVASMSPLSPANQADSPAKHEGSARRDRQRMRAGASDDHAAGAAATTTSPGLPALRHATLSSKGGSEARTAGPPSPRGLARSLALSPPAPQMLRPPVFSSGSSWRRPGVVP